MSHPIPTHEPDTPEMYDWHHQDILDKPPYTHRDMVHALAEGKFVIEGKKSDISDAEMFAQYHSHLSEVWEALREAIVADVEATIAPNKSFFEIWP